MAKKALKPFLTRVVHIGNLPIGGNNPIRIQSMITTSTKDIEKSVDQIMQLSDGGCEIVRMAVQGRKEAESCETIKNFLLQKGYTIPLVADIHFYPPAAFFVADFVEKVRINPGNFFDKRAVFQKVLYTEAEYLQELQKMQEAFLPFVEKLKKQKKALRIGANLGSLSDRIMSRFGDTPKGMVESALEYAEFCRNQQFHDLVFSMKASNSLLMIQAYRLLVKEMQKRGWDYPLHLGVTEAGEGLEGRIKSSLGIGSLLLDGFFNGRSYRRNRSL
jgi:(E)-4-hydroxy-3-methylbut-2-enyl-diphosphate synthase